MKKNTKIIVPALALAILAGGVGTAAYADNSNGNYKNRPQMSEEMRAQMQENREQMQANREAMQTALENSNYETFKSLASVSNRNKEMANITQTDFLKLVEAHKLHNQARALQDEVFSNLGIEKPDMGNGHKEFRGNM